MKAPQIKLTEDGSHTLYVPALDECYHSTHGSVQESNLIFIQYGLKESNKKALDILEIGFGTGLNAFLTFIATQHSPNKKINYTGIELYPVDAEEAVRLNYPEIIDGGNRETFEKMHLAHWNEAIEISENFTLTKLHTDFTKTEIDKNFDVIYFDAFSPEKQPEMWDENMFKKLYLCASDNAVITTYCAKGVVRRAMMAAGFDVERLPGPIGKREVLRGIKQTK